MLDFSYHLDVFLHLIHEESHNRLLLYKLYHWLRIFAHILNSQSKNNKKLDLQKNPHLDKECLLLKRYYISKFLLDMFHQALTFIQIHLLLLYSIIHCKHFHLVLNKEEGFDLNLLVYN